ncbi:hypothetical protein [Desulfobacula sp.]|uniref:hypothetical protein n=1 Tax=Desulfobacula sp. TaxID=2593537 RepID=UPI002614F96C|nr:hypothetical protein [Desulfobacula sp.]
MSAERVLMTRLVKITITTLAIVLCTTAVLRAGEVNLIIYQPSNFQNGGYGLSNGSEITGLLNAAFGNNVTVVSSFNLSQTLSADAIWLDLPYSKAMSASDRAVLSQFISTGKRVMMNGERSRYWKDWNNSILSIVGGIVGPDYTPNLVLNPIILHQLTDGVDHVTGPGNAGTAQGGIQVFSDYNVITLWGQNQNVLSILDISIMFWNTDASGSRFRQNVVNWLSDPIPGAASLKITSSTYAQAALIDGTLSEQIDKVNFGPPAHNSDEWSSVQRQFDNHVASSFGCSSVPEPLNEPYISANEFIDDANEVTYDNCSSSFYKFTFEVPNCSDVLSASLNVNVDDMAVAYLNGYRISPKISADDFTSEAGRERTENGLPILSWPNLDTLNIDSDKLVKGENVLVFGVIGDAINEFGNQLEPTGVEFILDIDIKEPPCKGDLDENGKVDKGDIILLLQVLSGDRVH